MYEAIQKIKEYQNGMIKQFNLINNTIHRDDQDEETRKTLIEIVQMINSIDKIVSYLKKHL